MKWKLQISNALNRLRSIKRSIVKLVLSQGYFYRNSGIFQDTGGFG